VGSCTDLRATVQIPLQRLYGDHYAVAPLSVLVDPLRAARAFGVDPGPSFSSRVMYIYEKQLEEADLLVLNKIDLVPLALRETLAATLARRYPRAQVQSVSARTGAGVAGWLDRLLEHGPAAAARESLEVDYDVYADGEARLGWVNATVRIAAAGAVDGNALLVRLADGVRERLLRAGTEIAHLKMTLLAGGRAPGLAAVNVVRSAGPAELAQRLDAPLGDGELIVNLRAEDDPEGLHAVLLDAVALAALEAGVEATIERETHFRPARPVPTHRMGAR
jgi:hypothetical protein